ncbi:MAG: hypothetical protein U5K51_06175 [Flavobacteriaceae bacterium]|nr:hypothetical protein [Flavobacteriaceae bacterium]
MKKVTEKNYLYSRMVRVWLMIGLVMLIGQVYHRRNNQTYRFWIIDHKMGNSNRHHTSTQSKRLG